MASSSAAYATVAQLLVYHDARRIGDLVSDTDVRVATGTLATNAVVAAMLKRASGEVEFAAQVGGRYTPAQLASLAGVAAEGLAGIVCDLTRWHLEKRRSPNAKLEDVPGAKEAHEVLAALRDGELIFPTDEALDAVGIDVVPDEATTACGANQCGGRYGETVGWARRFFGQRGGGCC